ncbi:ABC transporter ATP-binding protein [Candidatus Riflebacteria bacterium]
MSYAVETYQLTKTVGLFNKINIIDKLNLKVEQGRIFGLLGPNGAGKSTFFKLLLGLMKITSGKAFLFGEKVPSPLSRKKVGFLPETMNHYEYMNIGEYLRYYASLQSMGRVQEKISDALKVMGMRGHDGIELGICSKGMKQRVDLARLLMMDAELILMDEPVSGLDPQGQIELKEILLAMKKKGCSIVLNSHAVGILSELCDDIGIMQNGQLRLIGNLSVLLKTREVCVLIQAENSRKLDNLLKESDLKIARYEKRTENRCELFIQGQLDLTQHLVKVIAQGVCIIHAKPLRKTLEQLFIETANGTGTEENLLENSGIKK